MNKKYVAAIVIMIFLTGLSVFIIKSDVIYYKAVKSKINKMLKNNYYGKIEISDIKYDKNNIEFDICDNNGVKSKIIFDIKNNIISDKYYYAKALVYNSILRTQITNKLLQEEIDFEDLSVKSKPEHNGIINIEAAKTENVQMMIIRLKELENAGTFYKEAKKIIRRIDEIYKNKINADMIIFSEDKEGKVIVYENDNIYFLNSIDDLLQALGLVKNDNTPFP
jgi:hypothetical protein